MLAFVFPPTNLLMNQAELRHPNSELEQSTDESLHLTFCQAAMFPPVTMAATWKQIFYPQFGIF